jgi:hypothetical protein
MFPDVSNETQRAALRLAAERARAAGSSQNQYTAPSAAEQMRERFPPASAEPAKRAALAARKGKAVG